MNWIGGARNRIKFRGERKLQKEFFDRKRFGSNASKPISTRIPSLKRPGGSQDLLALQTVEKSHSALKSAHLENNPIHTVDLDARKFQSCTQKIIRNVDMGLESPCQTPSKLLLLEAMHSTCPVSAKEPVLAKPSKPLKVEKHETGPNMIITSSKNHKQTDKNDPGNMRFSFSKQSKPEDRSKHEDQSKIRSHNSYRSLSKGNSVVKGGASGGLSNMYVSEDFQMTPLNKYTKNPVKVPSAEDLVKGKSEKSSSVGSDHCTSTPQPEVVLKSKCHRFKNLSKTDSSQRDEISPILKISETTQFYKYPASRSKTFSAEQLCIHKDSRQIVSPVPCDKLKFSSVENLCHSSLQAMETQKSTSSSTLSQSVCSEVSLSGNRQPASYEQEAISVTDLKSSPVFRYSKPRHSQRLDRSLKGNDIEKDAIDKSSKKFISGTIEKPVPLDEEPDFLYKPFKKRKLNNGAPHQAVMHLYNMTHERNETYPCSLKNKTLPGFQNEQALCQQVLGTSISLILEKDTLKPEQCSYHFSDMTEQGLVPEVLEEHVVPASTGTHHEEWSEQEQPCSFSDAVSPCISPGSQKLKDLKRNIIHSRAVDMDEILKEMSQLEQQESDVDDQEELVKHQINVIEDTKEIPPSSEIKNYLDSERELWAKHMQGSGNTDCLKCDTVPDSTVTDSVMDVATTPVNSVCSNTQIKCTDGESMCPANGILNTERFKDEIFVKSDTPVKKADKRQILSTETLPTPPKHEVFSPTVKYKQQCPKVECQTPCPTVENEKSFQRAALETPCTIGRKEVCCPSTEGEQLLHRAEHQTCLTEDETLCPTKEKKLFHVAEYKMTPGSPSSGECPQLNAEKLDTALLEVTDQEHIQRLSQHQIKMTPVTTESTSVPVYNIPTTLRTVALDAGRKTSPQALPSSVTRFYQDASTSPIIFSPHLRTVGTQCSSRLFSTKQHEEKDKHNAVLRLGMLATETVLQKLSRYIIPNSVKENN